MLPQHIAIERGPIREILAGFLVLPPLLAEVTERTLRHRHVSIGVGRETDRPQIN